MKVDGRCHCGNLVFEAEIDPADVQICHCHDCQTLSGSAFSVIVPAIPGTFRFVSGEPSIYIKTAESGNRRRQAFCHRCGTRIFSGPDDQASTFFGLRVGTLSQRGELVPHTQIWRRSALPWVDHIAEFPRQETES
ncbi:MAG: GFA family protein [Aestuariivirga sp.]